jgi:hypothetical protein
LRLAGSAFARRIKTIGHDPIPHHQECHKYDQPAVELGTDTFEIHIAHQIGFRAS